MARILYSAFDVYPSPKGASTHITYFVRGLAEAGHDVTLLTPGDGLLPAREDMEGARVLRVALPGNHNYLQRALAFGEAVLAHARAAPRYDLAHYRSAWGGLELAQAKRSLGCKTLYEVNGLPSVELKYHYPGLRGSDLLRRIRAQELLALALSDAVICPAEVTRAFLFSLGVPRQRITVIPNGVNPRLFHPLPQSAGVERTPQMLYIGTLADWQGLTVLVRALPHILAVTPICLRIIGRGRGRQRKALLKLARRLGVEEALSLEEAVPHHDIPAVIAAADLCAAPLGYNDRNVTQGCCPIKVLEYMACGRPLLAANLPVVRELVREDVDALLFDPDNPADLARQALRLLQERDLAQQLAASAAQRVANLFTWHAAQKKLLRVYRDILR